jgi:hypothetical protein
MSALRHSLAVTPPTPPSACSYCETPGQLDLRKRIKRNSSISLEWQCLACGHSIAQPVSKKAVPDWQQLPEWDATLNKAYAAEAEAKRLQAYVDKKAAERVVYHAYLQTGAWREKSRKVLRRDPTCTACGDAPSKQAHHLTYGRIYREPLFDLVGVCRPCHVALHSDEALDEAIAGSEPPAEELDFG